MKALSADVGTSKGQSDIFAGIPSTESLKYLVHNAAVGEPGRLGEIDGEYALIIDLIFMIEINSLFVHSFTRSVPLSQWMRFHMPWLSMLLGHWH